MKNFIMSAVTLFVFCCMFFLLDFNSYAATYEVDYMEPTYGDNSGYIILEYASGTVATYFWSAYSQSEYLNDVEAVDTSCSIVIDDQKVIFTILTDSNIDPEVQNVTTQYTFSNYATNGYHYMIKSGSVVDSNPTYTYTTSATIVGFTYRGNVSVVTEQIDVTNRRPVVVWGDDVTGQYVDDLYQLISSNNGLMETYLPKLNKIEAWESRNNEQLELLVSLTTDILNAIDVSGGGSSCNYSPGEYLELLDNINGYLSSIDVDVGLLNEAFSSLLSVVNDISQVIEDMYASVNNIDATTLECLSYLHQIYGKCSALNFDVDNMDNTLTRMNTLLAEYIPLLRTMNTHVAYIEYDVDQIDNNVAYMKDKIDVIIEMLGTMSDSDKQVSDKFQEDSSSQSESLNDLNEQAQVNKPNVDDMSNTVDEHLNVDIDANYGLLLSSFTSNNRILTMLLIVASISLISFVFFGKR